MRLGRAVTIDDMREVHKGCRHCLGTVLIRLERPGKLPRFEFCGVALKDFAEASNGRIAEGPHGETYWISGAQPEEWAFTTMFVDELLERASWHDLAQSARRFFKNEWPRPMPSGAGTRRARA